MPVLNKYFYFSFITLLTFISCKKELEVTEVYDNVIYQVDSTKLYASSAEKVKQKTQAQYISIMYSDLFSFNISGNELSELSELSLAIGDKTMANELSLSHFLNSPLLDEPSDAEMRADLDNFVELTYLRFYQRNPTPYEKLYLTDVIEKENQISVLDVYTAFILSDEYYYY